LAKFVADDVVGVIAVVGLLRGQEKLSLLLMSQQ